MKVCSTCKNLKSLNEYHASKASFDKHCNSCKTCANLRATEWSKNNRQIANVASRMWGKRNLEKRKVARLKWKTNNSDAWLAIKRNNQARRRMLTKAASPSWLTTVHKLQILEFYKDAVDLQWLSQGQLHVDHIVPLRGEDICGLHVPWNLQILPASENIKKSNKI